jgi:cephalosporin hydroxylase
VRADGTSLEMWLKYFGEGCKIIGVDINPECKQHESENIEIFIGGQQDSKTIQEILEKYSRIDIVIDDGSHKSLHMIATFEMLYQHIDPNGVYLVEDTHACYWKEMGGGAKFPGSFMEFA